MHRLAALFVSVLTIACVGRSGDSGPVTTQPAEPPGLREEGLLLLMADRRSYDPYTVRTISLKNPELHAALAVSLGRIGDRRGLRTLNSMLLQGKPVVRREVVFALGLIGDAESEDYLRRAVADSDLETAIWAIVALNRLGAAGQSLSLEQLWRRLAPSLFRFRSGEIARVASHGLAQPTPAVRRMTMYALARNAELRGVPELRRALGEGDPWLRGWAANRRDPPGST